MPKFEFLNDPREVSNGNAQPPTPNTVSHSTNHEEVQSAESPCFANLTTSIPLDSPTVRNEVQPNSTRVSFSDIQKVLSIPEMQKSKRSEESQVVTSSLYKQSLIDNINEQKNKPLKAKKKQLTNKKHAAGQKGQKKKVAKTEAVASGNLDNAQCPMWDGFWSELLPGEEWVLCSVCEKWLHEECCTFVTPSTATCDVCL